jgi:hypothetical protein
MHHAPVSCPHVVSILAAGLDALPKGRRELPHIDRLIDAGDGWDQLPSRWQLARLQSHGYDIALIGDASAGPLDAQTVGDEAVRFIASRHDGRPFALSLVLPCNRSADSLQRFDRAVGQVITALSDWGHDAQTVVLLGPVRKAVAAASSQHDMATPAAA